MSDEPRMTWEEFMQSRDGFVTWSVVQGEGGTWAAAVLVDGWYTNREMAESAVNRMAARTPEPERRGIAKAFRK